MSATLDVTLLSRRELENLLLTSHGALQRILRVVRETTGTGWKVRREVEKIAEETTDRRPFTIALVRLTESRGSEIRAERNERVWEQWRSGE